jgi:hypothetical protein
VDALVGLNGATVATVATIVAVLLALVTAAGMADYWIKTRPRLP